MQENVEIGLGIVAVLVILGLFALLWKYKKLLKAKEEKIEWLREVGAKNDHKHTSQTQEHEKKIVELNHTIERLETKVKEGTKNQVVSKIEAHEAKRAKLLERAGIKL